MKRKVTYKPYTPNQLSMFPQNLGTLIASNHPVRIVNSVIDQLDLSVLHASYKGGGASSYHPAMLLKVLIYAYLKNIYSSRKIEEALQENIHFMWLSSQQTPDHSTIADFRSNRLKGIIKDLFSRVVLLLAEEGLVNIKDLYTDGTKLEAQAGRYTFVWGKAIKTNRARIKKQLKELWDYVEELYEDEKEALPEQEDLEEIDPEKVAKAVREINALLEKKKKTVKDKTFKKMRQKAKYGEKNWVDKLNKYEIQEHKLAGRNSYSKTDEDATFMRTKEDHMKNGQLKPCYNLQVSSNDKVVVNYSCGQSSNDTILYKTHHDEFARMYGRYPQKDTADAGYGSEENYEYLESKGIEGYVKFSHFHLEQKASYKKQIFRKGNLHYDKEQDVFYCPIGQKMALSHTKKGKTRTGFEQKLHVYEAKKCEGCPMRGSCHKGKGNRKIQVNWNLERHKKIARNRLHSEEGKRKRGQRCVDVEGVFGQLKHNKGFRRFLLRGLEKIDVELGLLFIGMNIDRKKQDLANLLGSVCPVLNELAQNEAIRGHLSTKRA